MRFFEFTDPYYALIAAKDEEEAIKTYDENVADYEDEYYAPVEITEEEMWKKYEAVNVRDELFSMEDVEQMIREGTPQVILIDGSLL